MGTEKKEGETIQERLKRTIPGPGNYEVKSTLSSKSFG
jgi:hypothetical protein